MSTSALRRLRRVMTAEYMCTSARGIAQVAQALHVQSELSSLPGNTHVSVVSIARSGSGICKERGEVVQLGKASQGVMM